MGICYIVGAGEDFVPFIPNENDFVIAADGGYEALRANGIRVDLLVGDFDSLSGSVPFPEQIPHLSFPKEKDETDTYLAFLEGYRLGYRDFVLLSCTGGRADHTFANYQLLLTVKNKGARATLCDGKNCIFCVKNEAAELSAKVGTRVSVFALDGVASGISLRGFSYPLENGSLSPEFPLGVSNATSAEHATIEVKDGALLVFAEPSTHISYRPLSH